MDKLLKLPLILLLLTFISCSSTALRPSASNSWKSKYHTANQLLATNEGDRGCLIFKELNGEPEFPLRPLTRVKEVEACPTEQLAKELWKNEGRDIPRWAKEYYTRQSLKIALQLGLKEEAAYFSSELSDYQAPKAERIALMTQAYEWAAESKKEEYRTKLIKLSPQLLLTMNTLLTADQLKLKKKRKNYIADELLMDLAQDLEKDRKFFEARKYYQLAIASSTLDASSKNNAWKRQCLSYKLERERELYVKCFSKHIAEAPSIELPDEFIVDLKISYARALWTIDKTEESEKELMALLASDKVTAAQRSRIHQAIAGIEQEAKNYPEAFTQFQLALIANPESSTEERENLFWRLGFVSYLSENYTAALEYWRQIAQHSTSLSLKTQSAFWSGKTLQKLNRRDEAEDYFKTIAQVDSFGYYGILAHRELGIEFKSLIHLSNKEMDPEEIPLTLEWLLATGEDEAARRFLRFYSYQLKSEEEVLKALPIFHYAKAYDLSILMFYKIPAEKRNELLEELAAYVFPLPYNREILQTASRFSVPPEYIFSIIRQESAFNTYARSFADAFGLMQVIPEKAILLGKSLEVNYSKLDDLYLPEVNLPLGTAILADNINRYKRSFVASTAAYNAGDTPVARWYQDRYRGDLLEFIENIPYEETQTYVKLVMRNMINYYRLTTPTNFKFRDDFFNQL